MNSHVVGAPFGLPWIATLSDDKRAESVFLQSTSTSRLNVQGPMPTNVGEESQQMLEVGFRGTGYITLQS